MIPGSASTYAGYKGGFAEDFSYDVGVLRYNYPGEYAVGATKANTNEIYGAIGWKWVAVKHSHSTSNLFGTANSKGSAYTELNGSYAIEETGITLGAHYGKQTVANNSAGDYTDYNVKVSKNFSGIVLGLAYSKTNLVGFDKATGVLSLSRSM